MSQLHAFGGKKFRTLRLLVQTGFTLFCLFAGYRFYLFFLWATGQTEHYVPRPPAVEGFLPISALLGLKRLLLTGRYDMIHPAGLTIIMAALTIGLLLRKGFCGWICPVGFTSNLAEKTGARLGILLRPPVWIDYPLLSLKYILLVFFLYIIFWKMNITQIEAFQNSPYNIAADAKMLLFFLHPSDLAFEIMLFLVVVSFFIRNFWCRYLCPYGALLGLLALASPFQIKRDTTTCINCKKCEKICPASIRIAAGETMRRDTCIGCLECVTVCPQKDCLKLSAPGDKGIPPLLLPLTVLAVFFLFWLIATTSGHWHTEVPLPIMQKHYALSAHLPHPPVTPRP